MGQPDPAFCPVYKISGADDPFGCEPKQNNYALPSEYEALMDQNGKMPQGSGEPVSPILSMLLQETHKKRVFIEPRSLAVAKRGVCTFVAKARAAQQAGADIGLVVNNEEDIIDMPAGKEKTADLKSPLGISRESEGNQPCFLAPCPFQTRYNCINSIIIIIIMYHASS